MVLIDSDLTNFIKDKNKSPTVNSSKSLRLKNFSN